MKKFADSIYIILAGIFWGTMTIFVRALSNSYGFSPLQITTIRFLVGDLFLALFVLFYNRKCFKVYVRDLPMFALMGCVSCFCMGYFYFAAAVLMPVSVASIIMYTAPIWVLIMSVIFFKEKLYLKKIVALVLAIFGCICVSGFAGGGVNAKGVIFALLSSFAYASYSILGKAVTKKYDPICVTLYSYFFAAIFSVLFCNVKETASMISAQLDIKMLLLSIGLGVISMTIPFTLYTIGLSKIAAGKAAIMSLTEPMVTVIVGVFAFRETISLLGIIGIICIVTAIVLLNTKKTEKKKSIDISGEIC